MEFRVTLQNKLHFGGVAKRAGTTGHQTGRPLMYRTGVHRMQEIGPKTRQRLLRDGVSGGEAAQGRGAEHAVAPAAQCFDGGALGMRFAALRTALCYSLADLRKEHRAPVGSASTPSF